MTPSQVWTSFCTLLAGFYPNCKVHRLYLPFEDFENIAYSERPEVFVQLSSASTTGINSNANIVEDEYQFRITYLWRMRNKNDMNELDKRLNAVQDYLTVFRQRFYDVSEDCRLYFGQPSCDTVYDEDILTGNEIFASTYLIPISVYRDVSGN